ncbi:amino acid/amide ABC transporter membrane protein 2 (HAAT family) /amino acid/amide ABC transporter ATP-binding protein 1 (HAAT family) [Bradyrhizobium sp. R2.2-H]|jgi:branched-chain amino acid transport system permease protein|uniref:branched-chain amino acid ABC transporter ATP-binding protein/permease n=1 Tax=unclassified Bradyrhizobium TaxID=2631580 RepID=UPI001043AFE0|nr:MULTISPECIES: branched-chain amino acid ABC transporter ATP-binding protein/permease [unclassified Bradyrhizobium]TCU69317.1 amino acid/amide ABC transporter membrane protein 2 (HAAT family) /amino acid/amide ABC transporter ATP-binding protein 1 (HAAT family) [Bradyrhizobium sp. Y-H1]TCU70809.1 amino acid/amide ABC transporter membrane protein 2 (HAAT family) /amino acid/amide ABC transporter ATP-binding protein 1 (HAAT family) [Bradyrhizobium sp. R2.2-H]
MTMLRMRSFLPPLLFTVAYAVVSLGVTNSYYQLILTLVPVWAVFGLSWNLLSGYTGLISFGHAAFFGIGAYATALGQIYFDISPWLLIPIAAVLGGIAGLLIGFPTFRLQGHYFALAMLAYPLAILYVFEWLGYQEVTLPIKRDAPIAYMQFSDPHLYTLLGLALMLATIVLTQVIERSRFGMALLAIKQNEAAAEAAGINTLAWKLRAITLSGAIAAVIGGFYAQVLLVVTPASVFGMLVSAQALTVAMFGGVGTVWGPVIGSVILIPLAEVLHAEAGARIPGIQGVIFGIAIVCVILLAPEGLFWKLRDLLRKRNAAKASASDTVEKAAANVTPLRPASQRAAAGEVVLEVRNLSRSFGGLKAVQDVNFKLHKNEILGIIGPNGAGKTTLFNLLNGFLKPSQGEVLIGGRNMSGQRPHVICEAGIGRTFQVMRPFLRMSILDNVVVGAYIRARTDDQARQFAADAVARVGLSAVADRVAGELSTKELRLMELARAIAGQPRILLLDETLAGLGHGEADEVVAVIQQLARDGITIAIIEHTMQAMVRLVDRFLVLDHGAVITEGLPEVVTRDSRVVEAYLGKKWAGHAAN